MCGTAPSCLKPSATRRGMIFQCNVIVIMLWVCYMCVMDVLWMCYESVSRVLWECYENDMRVLWKCYESVMKVLWMCYGCVMDVWGMLWMCEGCYGCVKDVCVMDEWWIFYITVMLIFVFCFSGFFKWPIKIWPHGGVCVHFTYTSNPQHVCIVKNNYLTAKNNIRLGPFSLHRLWNIICLSNVWLAELISSAAKREISFCLNNIHHSRESQAISLICVTEVNPRGRLQPFVIESPWIQIMSLVEAPTILIQLLLDRVLLACINMYVCWCPVGCAMSNQILSSRWYLLYWLHTLRPRQKGRHYPDHNSNTIWLNCFPNCPMDNNTSLFQIMTWHRTDHKPLSEPTMAEAGVAYTRHWASMIWKFRRRLNIKMSPYQYRDLHAKYKTF